MNFKVCVEYSTDDSLLLLVVFRSYVTMKSIQGITWKSIFIKSFHSGFC